VLSRIACPVVGSRAPSGCRLEIRIGADQVARFHFDGGVAATMQHQFRLAAE